MQSGDSLYSSGLKKTVCPLCDRKNETLLSFKINDFFSVPLSKMGTTQALIFELNPRIGKEEKTWKFGKGNDLRFLLFFFPGGARKYIDILEDIYTHT